MVLLLRLLVACFVVGFSYSEEKYGNTYRIRLHSKAKSLEFIRSDGSDVAILWKGDDPLPNKDSRRKVMGNFFVIFNLTQEDNGNYIMRNNLGMPLSYKYIRVTENTSHHVYETGESLRINYNLDPKSCNIYFFPDSDDGSRESELVRNGRAQGNWYQTDCEGFELVEPCELKNTALQMSCSGRLEFRDAQGNKALVASVAMKSAQFNPSKIGIGIGVFCCVISCCVCLRRCCCGKSSSKEGPSEAPNAEPAVGYQQYNREPVAGRSQQLGPTAATSHRPQSPYGQTGPLIHAPPSKIPPAYSKVSGPEESMGAPTIPVPSDPDPGPRFELKGMTFHSALSSESTYSDVYNSEKLNFL